MPKWCLYLTLILVPLLAYSSSFHNGFVWDDHKVIEKGHLIQSLKNIPVLFYHDAHFNSLGENYEKSATLDLYRPVTLATFFLERAAFGLRSGWYHLVSVVIHIGCVFLLYWVAGIMGATSTGAFIAALIFAVHPGIAEAVHWVNGRSDPLGLLFFLGGLGLWLSGRFWWSVLFFVLSTLCKETSFILLFFLPLLYRPIVAKFARSPIPWLTLSLAFALGFGLRLVGLKRTAVSGGTAHLLHAAKRVLPLWFDHFFSLLRPHAMMPPSLYEKYLLVPGWKVLLSAVVIGAFVYWLWRRRERDPIGLWAFATCLGLWAPVSLLTYQEGWFGWGRYLYASLGLLVIWLAFVLSQSARFSELISLRAVKATVALVVVIMGLQTYLAGHDWKNDRTFAEGILVDHPEQSVGYSELAVVELHDEKPAQAIALLERAISIQPKNHFHWSRASDALMKLGRRDAAFVAADKALRLDPKDVGARYITAIALLGRRQEAPAAQLLLGAISDDPDQEGPWVTLKQVLTHLGPDSVFSAEVRRTISEPAFASIRGRVVALLASVFSPAQGS